MNNAHLPSLTQVWPDHEATEDHDVEIIAVHGLGADPATTWNKGDVNWLKSPEMLPRLVPQARIWTFNFQSNWTGEAPCQRSSTLGDQLLEFVAQKLIQGSRPIVFLGHSFGGIVIAQALVAATAAKRGEEILGLVTGAVFLGTPFGPTKFTKRAKKAMKATMAFGMEYSDTQKLLDDLTSPKLLLNISQKFELVAKERALDICCFFELLNQPIIKKPSKILEPLSRAATFKIVPEEMASLGSFSKVGLNATHTALNEYDSPKNGNYQLVSGKLVEFVKNSYSILDTRRKADERNAPVFSIPYLPNPDFVGRDDILEEIKRRLAWKGDNTQARVALCGLGGVGKTQIAIKYAYLHKKKYDREGVSVFWIRGANRNRFEESYLDLTEKAGISINNVSDRMQAIQKWLMDEKNGRWLMIIDNADDADIFNDVISEDEERVEKAGLSRYIPSCAHGSVLFTSRDRGACVDLAGPNSWIQVGQLGVEACRRIFKQSLTIGQLDEGVDFLIDALEALPLALCQAVSFIAKRGITVSDYLKLFRESEVARLKLLGENFQAPGRDAIPNMVAATWTVSFNQIKSKEPLAASILGWMSYLDRQAIPKALLPVQDYDASQYAGAISVLEGYSMITQSASEDTYNMHALVQLSMQRWLSVNGEDRVCIAKVLDTVNCQFPRPWWVEDWRLCEPYFPHARSTLHYAHIISSDANENSIQDKKGQMRDVPKEELLSEAKKYEISLLIKTSSYLKFWAQVWDSEILELRAYEISNKMFGLNHETTLDAMYELADSYLKQDRNEDAEILLREIIARRSKEVEAGNFTRGLLNTLGLLAGALVFKGYFEEAEALETNLLAIEREKLSDDDDQPIGLMYGLALIYHLQDRYVESERLLKEVIELVIELEKKRNVPTLPSLWVANRALAESYRCQGRLREAETLGVETLTQQRNFFGNTHPHTQNSLHTVANTLCDQGRNEEASRMLLELYHIMVSRYGFDNLGTIAVQESMARNYERWNDWKVAEKLRSEVLHRTIAILGENHPQCLQHKFSLAKNWIDQGQHRNGKRMLREILEQKTRDYGPNDPSTKEVAKRLSEWEALPRDLDRSGNYIWEELNEEARRKGYNV